MINVLWWIGIFGGIAALMIIVTLKNPFVEQAEELLDEIEEESRHF